MKKANIAILIFMLLLVNIFLISCETNKIPEYKFVNASYQFDQEGGDLFFTGADKYQSSYAVYYFGKTYDETEKPLDRENKNRCIYHTEKILTEIGLSNVEIAVFASEQFDYKLIENNALRTKQQDWTSVEYIADLLLLKYGKFCNYGLVYGYANRIAETLKFDCDKVSLLPSITNSILYDMNLLCFDSSYVTEGEIRQAKALSVFFVDSYISEHGEQQFIQLLSDSGDISKISNVNEQLMSEYRAIGIDCTSTTTLYAYGGESCVFFARSESAVFYVNRNWVDSLYAANPMVSKSFLKENYNELRHFFETTSQQMKDYQVLFDMDEYNNDLIIHIRNDVGAYSYYTGYGHQIYLKNISSLMHEYIHSLTVAYSKDSSWSVEGFARYYSYRYDEYGLPFVNNDYNNTNPNDNATRYVREYLEKIGRPVDMKIDYKDLENIAVYSHSAYDIDRSYLAGSSFIQFLVNKYGEDTVINYCCCKNGKYAELDKTVSELVAEWKTFIEQTYQGYYVYK